MFRNLFAAMCAVLFTLAAGTASAQTISQPDGGGNIIAEGLGQSFTATVSGTVTQIQVRARTDITTRVYFFNGAGSGVPGSNASAVSSQSVTLVDQGSDTAGFQTIVLATPLPVVAGNVYAFAFEANVMMSMDSDPYAGGNVLSDYDYENTNTDLVFTVTQVATPAAVPTMTEWAMILFGTILAGGAALYIQRRRQFA